ncbi:MAG: c-type cytochrome [Burkholderiaceae bacterium]
MRQAAASRWLLAATLAGVAAGAWAAEPVAAPAKAATCTVCHGPQGLAVAPDTPNLAGQPGSYLSEQLRAFRGGQRQHQVMTLIAKPLSDDEIAQLAAWFASFRVELAAPR